MSWRNFQDLADCHRKDNFKTPHEKMHGIDEDNDVHVEAKEWLASVAKVAGGVLGVVGLRDLFVLGSCPGFTLIKFGAKEQVAYLSQGRLTQRTGKLSSQAWAMALTIPINLRSIKLPIRKRTRISSPHWGTENPFAMIASNLAYI